MSDDELEHALMDWSLYLADEHGDLEPEQWATIDRLLDELGRRRGLDADVPYAPLGNPEFMPGA